MQAPEDSGLGSSLLSQGDLLPHIRVVPPGPETRRWSARSAAVEAPGINGLVHGQASVIWRDALGANVLDVDGNRYLDFTSGFGVAAIGHRHPRVVEAVQHQSERLLHGLGDVHPHPGRVRLAERLAEIVPVAEPRTYFAVSGADAVEIALKTALLATGRSGVLVFEPSYHGLTLGALAASARREFRLPFQDHLTPRITRLPFGGPTRQIETALAAGTVGCVLVEPVVGREGILLPPDGWLAELAELARRHGALFAADEIFTGFGRLGTLFSSPAQGVEPDLLCCGKALTGGLPLAAVIGERKWMEAWDRGGEALHTGTFVANPVACAAALAFLGVLEEEDLPGRAGVLGDRVAGELLGWQKRLSGGIEVRGRGLMWGIEVADRATAYRWADEARRRGVLMLAGGPHGRVAQLLPPLTITEAQLDTGLGLLSEALDRALED